MFALDQFFAVNRISTGAASALLLTFLASTTVLGQTSTTTEHTIEVFDVGLVRLDTRDGNITELMTAVDNGDVREVERLIRTGADVNAIDRDSQTALIKAASLGHMSIVRLLLESGAVTDSVSAYSDTALSEAVRLGHESIALMLLKSGASPSLSVSNSGYAVPRPLLAFAAARNQLAVVRALIAAGADIDAEGPAALNSAILNRNVDMIDMLLSSSVDVDAYVQGAYILYTAARRGDFQTVRKLLDHGANVDRKASYNGSSALFAAAAGGHADIVSELLVNNATVTIQDLKASMQKGQSDITLALLERLPMQELSDSTIVELLILAESSSDERVIESLLALKSIDSATAENASLVLVRSTAVDCKASHWRPETSTEQLIYQAERPCRGGFSIDDQASIFYVVADGTLQLIDLRGAASNQTIPLPVDLMESYRDVLLDKWRASYGEENTWPFNASGSSYVVAAGNLPNGDLGLLAYAIHPVDGHYAYLFVRSDDVWRLADEKTCGKFDNFCTFSEISGRPLWVPPDDLSVWHPNIRLNPYFMGKDILPSPADMQPDYPFTRAVLHFDIENRVSSLHYTHSESGHCGDHCDVTRELKFQLGDSEPAELVADYRPLGNSVVGRYILLSNDHRYDSFELFDIGTGRPIFKNLYSAAWAF